METNGQTIALMQQITQQQAMHTNMMKKLGEMSQANLNCNSNLAGLLMLMHCMQSAMIDSLSMVDMDLKQNVTENYEQLCKDNGLNPYPEIKIGDRQ